MRAAAAAKLAEKEAWEKTRGAGSSVLDLLKSQEQHEDEPSSDSAESSNERPTMPQLRKTSSASSSSSSSLRPKARAKERRQDWEACEVLPSLEEVQARRHEVRLLTPKGMPLHLMSLTQLT